MNDGIVRFSTTDGSSRLAWSKRITPGLACGFRLWVVARQIGSTNAAQKELTFHASDNGVGGVNLTDQFRSVPNLGTITMAVGTWNMSVASVEDRVEVSAVGANGATIRWALSAETMEV